MSLKSGTRLGPYEIEVRLGAGGMGEVYRARDTRLGRAVAVKLLPAATSADKERRERLDREARAVASLSHPHICALFDVGTHDDMPFLVMENIEGETLADCLRRGAVSVADALRCGSQIADALAAAHAHGIVHRDLKPANIKLTSRGVKVLDFGLAKFLTAQESSASPEESPTELATGSHVILGTAAYMSPEQARGKPVDHRSDAWSFGVVLYELLTGKKLFDGDTVTDILSAVLRDDIDLAGLPPETPGTLRDCLTRLLQRDADRRLSDLGEVSALLSAESTGHSITRHTSVAPEPADEASIVVLPFTNVSPDPENEYFSDGLTEEVIADLSKVGALRVISRTSAMRLKGTEKDLRAIADELGVRYALEGSVRKAGQSIRVTTQLIDMRTDAPLWSDKYTGTLDDVFGIQEKMSRAIVDSLRVTLTKEEDEKIAHASAHNVFAYDTYLRARRDIWSFKKESLDRARVELEHALELVGDDLLLYRGLGMVNWQYVNAGISGEQKYLQEAETYARKILDMDSTGPHGPMLLAYIACQRGDITEWVRQSMRAVEADPNDTDQLFMLATAWCFAGYPARAQPHFEKILSTDPLWDMLQFGLGFIQYLSGDFAKATEHCEEALRLGPDSPAWPLCIAQAAASAGEKEKAVRVVDEHGAAPSAHPLATLAHVYKHALLGDGDAVDALITDDFVDKIWGDPQYPHFMAQAQALLGRTDEGLKWLRQATERGYINYPFLSKGDPLLENLRRDPRFAELMEQVRKRWEGFEAEVGVK